MDSEHQGIHDSATNDTHQTELSEQLQKMARMVG